MEKQLFTGQNSFRGLQEAIEAVIQYSDDDDCDLAIIPPEPSALTDDEEGADEDMTTVCMPQDVPGTLEIFTHRDNSVHEDSSYDDSDDEPLASKRKRPNSTRESVSNVAPTWRKCAPSYSSAPQRTSQVSEKKNNVCEELKNLNPVQIFEKLFDDDIVDLIASNSTLYANQHNRHEFELVPCDLKKFIGILILSGYHKLPREPMYWSLDEDIGVELVSKAMSRHKFRDIKRNLHLVNNDLAGTSNDKMFKIRPLADKLMEKFLQWGVFHDSISVDESMVKYFGHHPAKQFIRGKPVRFGYKNWVAASSTGYCYSFDFYCGKSQSQTSDPLGSRVVKSLLEKLNCTPANHEVFFDNFFTSYDLLLELKSLGYRATGTVRENRTKKCPLTSTKEMKKKERASYDYRFDKNGEILLVRWKDNSVCTMATNYDAIEPFGTVKRWCPIKKDKTDVAIPRLFQTYNKNMGGVDELDQSISLYRVAVHGKKWWWVLFTYMLDMTVANAWRLHVMSHDNPMDQLTFRRHIARYYLRQGQRKSRQAASIVEGLPQDGVGHYPMKIDKPLRCLCQMLRVKAQW
ncbi:piggyBac transposable element-derived protein 3-like [Spodoptera litura]|uniref:PiggyBac transposable element-derived protein 3-like n=1 Tax=Spodoptera litura TaxID=69820 RepID=A0A9J7ITY4_SPOLT|nr:piggyBac transposable element-derived protein 3-like [Spodoptera litura]